MKILQTMNAPFNVSIRFTDLSTMDNFKMGVCAMSASNDYEAYCDAFPEFGQTIDNEEPILPMCEQCYADVVHLYNMDGHLFCRDCIEEQSQRDYLDSSFQGYGGMLDDCTAGMCDCLTD